MRVTEILRGLLDIIDQVESGETVTPDQQSDPYTKTDDINRFKQIVDLADSGETTEYSNTPKEEYASIEAVTTNAGGGVNGPKHPHDIRVKDPSAYPNQQEV